MVNDPLTVTVYGGLPGCTVTMPYHVWGVVPLWIVRFAGILIVLWAKVRCGALSQTTSENCASKAARGIFAEQCRTCLIIMTTLS